MPDPTPRKWVLPEEPAPIRLMSTIWADTDGLHDDFAFPADVSAWLAAIGVDTQTASPTAADLDGAIRLRDAARRLAAYVTEDDRPAAASAVASVNDAVNILNAHVSEVRANGLVLKAGRLQHATPDPHAGVRLGLAEVARATADLLADQSDQLRACHAPGCVLYFVKTHPRREWCSVAFENHAQKTHHYEKVRQAR